MQTKNLEVTVQARACFRATGVVAMMVTQLGGPFDMVAIRSILCLD